MIYLGFDLVMGSTQLSLGCLKCGHDVREEESLPSLRTLGS